LVVSSHMNTGRIGILQVVNSCLMSDQNKLALLNAISSHTEPGTPVRLSFNAFGKTLGLPKDEIDLLLAQLNKDRFISQYSKKGVDGFTLVLNQKGLDAVQDESFI